MFPTRNLVPLNDFLPTREICLFHQFHEIECPRKLVTISYNTIGNTKKPIQLEMQRRFATS